MKKHNQKMYNQFGQEYQKARDDRESDRLFNEFIEIPSMIKSVKNIKGKNILDVGCGVGIHAAEYAKSEATVVGVDISKTMIKLAKERFSDTQFFIASADKLPFKDKTFDVVTSSLMVSNIKNLKKTFQEINRVLKKRGLFYYSDISPIQASMESKKINDIKIFGIGQILNTKTGIKRVIGSAFKDKVKSRDFLPGMNIKYVSRTLESHIKPIVNSGFELIDFINCRPTKKFKKLNPELYNIYNQTPLFSIFVCRKK
ncbi:methyltransferase domain-containing protein [Candidatus Woesearchaeota archaeon]|nr:methyltransferase domain-containing protein [Candidatus Woesearchaeota archaeon]